MLDVLGAIHRRRGTTPGRRLGADTSPVVVGFLLAEPDATTYLCTVSILGSEPIPGVPATPSTYTGVTTVAVLMDPEKGTPVRVLGPAGAPPEELIVEPPRPSSDPVVNPDSPGSTRVVRGKVVLPSFTGTYRVSRSAWGRWNDAADVYQAGSASSGTLYGLAAYGNQITALGASSITRARLTLVSNGAGFVPAWDAVVRGSVNGTRPAGAPSYAGDTVTVSVPGYGKTGQSATVELGATMREALRDGTARGLGLVGATYGGTLGIGRGNGSAWALSLDYEVTT